MVTLESLVTVSYSHSIATMTLSLAVSIHYTVLHDRDIHPARQTDTAWQQKPHLCIASRSKI